MPLRQTYMTEKAGVDPGWSRDSARDRGKEGLYRRRGSDLPCGQKNFIPGKCVTKSIIFNREVTGEDHVGHQKFRTDGV